MNAVLPRDFIETAEGLIFAVVDALPEGDKVLCALRYQRQSPPERPRKLGTEEADRLVRDRFPRYLHHSHRCDATLHGVPHERIVRHFSAAARCAELLLHAPTDPLEARLRRLLQHLLSPGVASGEVGVTGSLLIGAQSASSDFDLVAYSRETFFALRRVVAAGLASGAFGALDAAAWRDAWTRRGCALALEEYVWHERRKANKALFEVTKFDLSLVTPSLPSDNRGVRKLGFVHLRSRVADASAAFDYPARYALDHPEIREILVFTHTYVGQAIAGEVVEAAGHLEEDTAGRRRMVIGSSREAPGEYLRVCDATDGPCDRGSARSVDGR